MKNIAPHFPGFIIHQYSTKSAPFAHKVFSDLKKYISENKMEGGNALFVLPENIGDDGSFVRNLHKIIKKELFETVKIKCVSATSLKRFLKIGVNEKYPFHIPFLTT
jgi:hypothetical protein